MPLHKGKRKTIQTIGGIAQLAEEPDVKDKEFGQDDHDGKDTNTWRNRERDWYNTERRFIFACESKQAADKWIANLSKKIKHMRKKDVKHKALAKEISAASLGKASGRTMKIISPRGSRASLAPPSASRRSVMFEKTPVA
jgi:hypothetical protein